VTGATLALDEGVELAFTLDDPGVGADADDLIRAPELASDGLISFEATTDGDAIPDLVIDAQVEVSALLPGLESGISLVTAGIKLSWASIEEPGEVSVAAGATPGSDVAEFLRFLDVTADQVLQQLTSLRDTLDQLRAAALNLDIPFAEDALDDVIDFIEALDAKIIDPLLSISDGGSINTTAQQLIVRLADFIGVNPASFGLAYDKTSHELTWQLTSRTPSARACTPSS